MTEQQVATLASRDQVSTMLGSWVANQRHFRLSRTVCQTAIQLPQDAIELICRALTPPEDRAESEGRFLAHIGNVPFKPTDGQFRPRTVFDALERWEIQKANPSLGGEILRIGRQQCIFGAAIPDIEFGFKEEMLRLHRVSGRPSNFEIVAELGEDRAAVKFAHLHQALVWRQQHGDFSPVLAFVQGENCGFWPLFSKYSLEGWEFSIYEFLGQRFIKEFETGFTVLSR